MSNNHKSNIPFVGLQPFSLEDHQYFYGREREVESILSILQSNKFVCITGPEGSGKSSLINAGLLHRLQTGFNGIEGNKWSVCKFRPSISPLENFTQALTFDGVLSVENKPNTTDYLTYFEIIKEVGADALMTIYNDSEIVKKHNLLVVIDQIEDIFT